jgi:hypothetical protein
MKRNLSIVGGFLLIVTGLMGLTLTLVLPLLGWSTGTISSWRLWPLAVSALGAALTVTPFLWRQRRGLGALLIPGLPILVSGGLLLFSSVFDAWATWAWSWPAIVLALGLGFGFAALWTRALGLLIPAVLILVNGLVFQFCAVTGWWSGWAFFWTLEPLALGAALLLFNLKHRKRGLVITGAILIAIATVSMIGMSALFTGSWLIQALGPLVMLGLGTLLVIRGLSQSRTAPQLQVE